MNAEQLVAEIKSIKKAVKRAQDRLDAREDALQELRHKWAIATAEEHGVVVGQKRYITPRKSAHVVDDIAYADWAYPEWDIRKVAICFDYSSVDPVNLSAVLRESKTVTDDEK